MNETSRWTSISRDPNSPEVVGWRNRELAGSRREPVAGRVQYLTELARGRRVLDIGVVEHFIENQARDNWLHGRLAEVAASCRGVDILEDDVQVLRERGYDVVVHDLTTGPVEGAYDLVVMGDVIEHLGSPESFLANVVPSLGESGRLVVTTPNPYMLNRALHSLRGRFPDSVDHVVLLGPGNIAELAARVGLRLDTWRGVRLKDLPGWRNRTVTLTRQALAIVGFAPEIGCDTMIYELVPDR